MYFRTQESILAEELEIFRPCFSKPQWCHFQTYVTGLVVGEKGEKNVMDIAANRMDGKSQSSLNRFLTQSPWDMHQLDVRRLTYFLSERNGGVLSVDDTLLEKYGKYMEAVGWLYDPTQKKNVLAHNIVTTFYSNGSVQVPLHLAPYIKAELCANTDWHFKTKIQLAIELLSKALVYVKPDMVAFDEWYFSKEMVRFLNASHQNWVTQAKTNRMVEWKGKWISIETLFQQIPHNSYRRISEEIEEERYHWYCEIVLPLKHAGVVKLVLLKIRKNSRTFRVLVSNAITQPGEYLIQSYKKRWGIEVFYRDCKQHLGLSEYQVRGLGPVVIHLQLVFLAYTLLKNCRSPALLAILTGLKAIGSICKRIKRWIFDTISGYWKEKTRPSFS